MAQPSTWDLMSQQFSAMGQGARNLLNNPMDTIDNMGGIGKLGSNLYMAAMPAMMQQPQEGGTGEELDPNRGWIRPYTFSRTSTENRQPGGRYFDQTFTELPKQRPEDFEGYADGGTVTGVYNRISDNPVGTPHSNPLIAAQDAAAQRGSVDNGDKVYEFSRVPAEDDGSGRHWTQSFTLRPMTAEDRAQGLVALGASKGYAADKENDPGALIARMFGFDPYGANARENNTDAKPWGGLLQSIFGAKGWGTAPGGAQGYAGGGQPRMLTGPGDGQSDGIPALVDGVQPAALSVDEYVMPADAVSALGNGSSSAGAKELDRMVARVRQKAHGRKKQQSRIKPHSVMPA